MCEECWEGEDKPQIDNALVRLASELANNVYEYNAVGGRLHILLDDWNVEDGHINACQRDLDTAQPDDDPDQLAAELLCLRLFRCLTREERLSALALQEGLWG